MSFENYRVIDPARIPSRRRWPVRETEVTTVWNDGSYVKLNRFGETEHRTSEPLKMDATMTAFFEALDGVQAGLELAMVDLEAGEISL